MTNFLKETIGVLAENQVTEADVLWVGSLSGKFAMQWNDFVKIADIEYDGGYGGQEIAEDLVIVGKDFWFERGEYDGSEWWAYKSIPSMSTSPKSFLSVKNGNSWASLEDMNRAGR